MAEGGGLSVTRQGQASNISKENEEAARKGKEEASWSSDVNGRGSWLRGRVDNNE